MVKWRPIMKKQILLVAISFFMLSSSYGDGINLFDWAFNVNGDVFENAVGDQTQLPDYFDYSGFDWDEGTGTISVDYRPGTTGDHHVLAYFDHEIDEWSNTFFNEYGTVNGVSPDDLVWEIDEPGFADPYGDIYDNLLDNNFDNSNAIGAGNKNDVAMGIGWQFTLDEDEYAEIEFIITDELPDDGTFYLAHVDADNGKTIYLSTNIDIKGGPTPLPEPGTLSLLIPGIISIGLFRFFRRKKYKK